MSKILSMHILHKTDAIKVSYTLIESENILYVIIYFEFMHRNIHYFIIYQNIAITFNFSLKGERNILNVLYALFILLLCNI